MLCVSIILATYNSKENFLKTYKSICRQSYPCIEIVVVDGASTDGTREVIEQCALENKNLKWISEKDSGIYNAMNKGLHLSHGDVIVFFNDEFLVETAVEQYMKAIQESGAQGVHSDLVYRDEKGNIIRRWKMGEGDIRKGWLPGHPTLYLKREVYEEFGEFKEDYCCAADYEFMVRILKDGKIRLAYIPEELVSMFYGGTSSNGARAYWVSFKEGVKALKENHVKHALGITVVRMIKVMTQFH